MMMMDLLLVRK